MIKLYSTEYKKLGEIKNKHIIEETLMDIWENYKYYYGESSYYVTESDYNNDKQPFFGFIDNSIKTKNYVGYFRFNETKITVFPKIMSSIAGDYETINKLFNEHIFYWLKTCSKFKFPFSENNSVLEYNSELIEIFIKYIINKFNEIINNLPYYAYKIQQEELKYPKGKILFNQYINNYASGKGNLIPCEYEPFSFDNDINQLIKHCCRLLLHLNDKNDINLKLDKIIKVLDDVADRNFSLPQVELIRVPIYYSIYEEIIYLCKIILLNTSPNYLDEKEKSIAFLFPMEKIFEDFISSFIKTGFSKDYIVENQKSNLFLQENPAIFQIKQDIYIKNRNDNSRIIIDTKYKYIEKNDKNYGVSQSDIYQMISYAYKTGVDKIMLFYPNTSESYGEITKFEIKRHDKEETIKIKIIEVPFWSTEGTKNLDDKLYSTIKNGFESGF